MTNAVDLSSTIKQVARYSTFFFLLTFSEMQIIAF
jgi:hypothetical protein